MDTEQFLSAVWVRHGGEVYQLPLCPEAWPYTTVAHHRAMAGWKPGAPTVPLTIHCMVDETAVTVSGSGVSADDPMFCAEVQDKPLPVCRCAELAALLPPEPADEHAAPVPAEWDRPTRRPLRTVWLPGDEPA